MAAFGVAGGLGSAAIANKLIHFELTTVVSLQLSIAMPSTPVIVKFIRLHRLLHL